MKPAQTFFLALGVAVGIVVSLVLLALVLPSTSAPPPLTAVSAELSVNLTPSQVSPAFYGVGLRGDRELSSDSVSLLSATPIRFLRFPDGAIGERMDLVNGTLYEPGYSNTSLASVTTAQFVSVCRATNCSAIIQLPLEINDSATAAYEVHFIEDNLGFHPAYWELGNEPVTWECFDVPWVDWGTDCTGPGTTPAALALETHAYIAAVRGVDPAARFVGLGGTGAGNADDASWIIPLEQEDGPNLSAISIHSYVDDHIPSSTDVSLPSFFSGLSSAYSVPNILANARAAIASACPACATQVFITEMDSVSGFDPLAPYLSTYYNGVFFAAEEAQGLNSQAANIDPFCWENGLITAAGIQARYTIESQFLTQLGPEQYNASTNASGVYVAVTGGSGAVQLLAVNTGSTDDVQLSLAGSNLHFTGSIFETLWTSAESAPATESLNTTTASTLVLPPTSVVLVSSSGSVAAAALDVLSV